MGFAMGLGSINMEVGSGKLKMNDGYTGSTKREVHPSRYVSHWRPRLGPHQAPPPRAAARARRSLWLTPLESAGVTFWMRL
jgi:hypothetical protein